LTLRETCEEAAMDRSDPLRTRQGEPIPDWAERLVLFLDDGYVIPGTGFRVGFDAIVGLVPGIGDLLTTASSLSLVWLAQQRGASRSVITRMLANLAIDAMVGAVPVLGDLFDVVFKANRRNLELLQRYDKAPKEARKKDAVFVVMVVAGIILLLTVPITLAILIVKFLTD